MGREDFRRQGYARGRDVARRQDFSRREGYRRAADGSAAHQLANGLGWISLGLGVMEVVAPRSLARTLGMEGSEQLIRAYGVREIIKGVGILNSDDPTPWIWGRVAGDALDMGTLMTAYSDDNPKKDNVGMAMAAVAGITALDVYCAEQLSSGGRRRRMQPARDYSDRSGLPRPPQQMRGAARDFEIPPDFRTPEPLRPWTGQ
jgi:hypothetical protein